MAVIETEDGIRSAAGSRRFRVKDRANRAKEREREKFKTNYEVLRMSCGFLTLTSKCLGERIYNHELAFSSGKYSYAIALSSIGLKNEEIEEQQTFLSVTAFIESQYSTSNINFVGPLLQSDEAWIP